MSRHLFVCLFVSWCFSSLWWTLPDQGWNLHYPKAGRHDPLRVPDTDPSLSRVPGEFAVSGLLGWVGWVADWLPDHSSSLSMLGCWLRSIAMNWGCGGYLGLCQAESACVVLRFMALFVCPQGTATVGLYGTEELCSCGAHSEARGVLYRRGA